MTSTLKSASYLSNLDRLAKFRQTISIHLEHFIDILQQAEVEGEKTSGKLAIDNTLEDLKLATKNLRRGVFRLLILGDLKRGKSTFLNALIGEKLLPSDVNPCTAILTVLRYGQEKKVTIYYKDGKLPKALDFETFKQEYTIDPDEAKKLEQENSYTFADVDYAVVEYPLPLLEKGIEIIDTPGLNDTEARNKLSLSYINNCQAVLFIFRAIQPFTLDERRYLENYLKGRGLPVFFLINAWDEISKELIDSNNPEDIQKAEENIRQVFRTNLAEYCQVDDENIYDQRVFELSSLQALRQRIKNLEDPLEGTGFPQFLNTFNQFLTQERAIAQFYQAKLLATQAYQYFHEAIDRRLSLVAEDVNQVKQKITSVEPEFNQLVEVRDQFIHEIHVKREQKAKEVADSFKDYILKLGDTFEVDFTRYQPSLRFMDFLSQGKREEFSLAFKQAFERYINDKLSSWELTAENQLTDAFTQLAQSAANYGVTYNKILDAINEKLTGKKLYTNTNLENEQSPGWASWAMGFFSLATGNIAGIVMAGAGFNWKNILVNWIAVIGISSFLAIFAGGLLAPLGIWVVPLLGVGVGALQTEQARLEFIKVTKKEFVKHLPQLSQEQWQPIYQTVKDCFDTYELEVTKRINDDIKSRKAELDNLLKQKQAQEIDQEKEVKRLKDVDTEILTEKRTIESLYEDLLLSS